MRQLSFIEPGTVGWEEAPDPLIGDEAVAEVVDGLKGAER